MRFFSLVFALSALGEDVSTFPQESETNYDDYDYDYPGEDPYDEYSSEDYDEYDYSTEVQCNSKDDCSQCVGKPNKCLVGEFLGICFSSNCVEVVCDGSPLNEKCSDDKTGDVSCPLGVSCKATNGHGKCNNVGACAGTPVTSITEDGFQSDQADTGGDDDKEEKSDDEKKGGDDDNEEESDDEKKGTVSTSSVTDTTSSVPASEASVAATTEKPKTTNPPTTTEKPETTNPLINTTSIATTEKPKTTELQINTTSIAATKEPEANNPPSTFWTNRSTKVYIAGTVTVAALGLAIWLIANQMRTDTYSTKRKRRNKAAKKYR